MCPAVVSHCAALRPELPPGCTLCPNSDLLVPPCLHGPSLRGVVDLFLPRRPSGRGPVSMSHAPGPCSAGRCPHRHRQGPWHGNADDQGNGPGRWASDRAPWKQARKPEPWGRVVFPVSLSSNVARMPSGSANYRGGVLSSIAAHQLGKTVRRDVPARRWPRTRTLLLRRGSRLRPGPRRQSHAGLHPDETPGVDQRVRGRAPGSAGGGCGAQAGGVGAKREGCMVTNCGAVIMEGDITGKIQTHPHSLFCLCSIDCAR